MYEPPSQIEWSWEESRKMVVLLSRLEGMEVINPGVYAPCGYISDKEWERD